MKNFTAIATNNSIFLFKDNKHLVLDIDMPEFWILHKAVQDEDEALIKRYLKCPKLFNYIEAVKELCKNRPANTRTTIVLYLASRYIAERNIMLFKKEIVDLFLLSEKNNKDIYGINMFKHLLEGYLND